ncbi:MAG: SMI1/KNR4 family protein [Planctomycetaceae bacterium]|nr:SMI1/KNR4 family protein [Planctomycetaceae bacterium]
MSWLEKMQQTKLALVENPRLQIVFSSCTPAPETFIDLLRDRYPFLPETYLLFLKQTDGADICMFVLAGSGESSFPSIETLIKRWKPNLGSGPILPIGEDPSGDCIAIIKDGSVVAIDYTIDSTDEATYLADSFDDFLDNVLMGNKYPSLFPGGLTPHHENEWTHFLREKGWLGSV